MDDAFDRGIISVLPDLRCFELLLDIAARRTGERNGGHVDDIFRRMRERFLVPSTSCFESAIASWKHHAFSVTDKLDDEASVQRSVRRVMELLALARLSYKQNSETQAVVTTKMMNDVLETLRLSSHPDRCDQAEILLRELEDAISSDEPFEGVGTCPNSHYGYGYAHVIQVWSASDSQDKVSNAMRVLENMVKRRNDINNYIVLLEGLNSFLKLCDVSPAHKSTDNSTGYFREALSAMELCSGIGGVVPNETSYSHLLNVCAKSLNSKNTQREILDRIFGLCCSTGTVTERVLKTFKDVATSEQHSYLVSQCERLDGTRVIPTAWSKNSTEKIKTITGQQSLRLALDGHQILSREAHQARLQWIINSRKRKSLREGRKDTYMG